MATHTLTAPTSIGNGTMIATPMGTFLVASNAINVTPPSPAANGQVDNVAFFATIEALLKTGWTLTAY